MLHRTSCLYHDLLDGAFSGTRNLPFLLTHPTTEQTGAADMELSPNLSVPMSGGDCLHSSPHPSSADPLQPFGA